MAEKRPLVLGADGNIKELEDGDTVDVRVLPPTSGGTGDAPSMSTVMAIAIALG